MEEAGVGDSLKRWERRRLMGTVHEPALGLAVVAVVQLFQKASL
jgi:hypothetical protein